MCLHSIVQTTSVHADCVESLQNFVLLHTQSFLGLFHKACVACGLIDELWLGCTRTHVHCFCCFALHITAVVERGDEGKQPRFVFGRNSGLNLTPILSCSPSFPPPQPPPPIPNPAHRCHLTLIFGAAFTECEWTPSEWQRPTLLVLCHAGQCNSAPYSVLLSNIVRRLRGCLECGMCWFCLLDWQEFSNRFCLCSRARPCSAAGVFCSLDTLQLLYGFGEW